MTARCMLMVNRFRIERGYATAVSARPRAEQSRGCACAPECSCGRRSCRRRPRIRAAVTGTCRHFAQPLIQAIGLQDDGIAPNSSSTARIRADGVAGGGHDGRSAGRRRVVGRRARPRRARRRPRARRRTPSPDRAPRRSRCSPRQEHRHQIVGIGRAVAAPPTISDGRTIVAGSPRGGGLRTSDSATHLLCAYPSGRSVGMRQHVVVFVHVGGPSCAIADRQARHEVEGLRPAVHRQAQQLAVPATFAAAARRRRHPVDVGGRVIDGVNVYGQSLSTNLPARPSACARQVAVDHVVRALVASARPQP